MNIRSHIISGIRESTAPAPNPCRHLAAKWLVKLVLCPAPIPPIHASRPASISTGLRPIATDSGTRKNEAIPLTRRGSVDSRMTLDSGVPFSSVVSAASAFVLWIAVPLCRSLYKARRSEALFGSMLLYSRKNRGMRCPMTLSIDIARDPTARVSRAQLPENAVAR